jgi:phosphatidylserine decarboxylase
MAIHKEGHKIILVVFVVIAVLGTGFYLLFPHFRYWHMLVYLSFGLFLGWTVLFFRSPERKVQACEDSLISPADGRIVVIEDASEDEFFRTTMKKVSIFMSPFNVHLNRNPASGRILHYRYHAGKYLVAWHPKSSTLNERTSIAMETTQGHPLMIRQVAGFLARRIVCYHQEQISVVQGEELGFIKFGSRVDVYMPTDCEVHVALGDHVRGGLTRLATLPKRVQ